MSAALSLPSYKDQSPEVAARFARLRVRPVALEVKGLTKRFETPRGIVTALDDVSFSVHKRELMCVIGPSGCGKSTLVRILAGLETASEGEVLVGGTPVSGPGPDRGMVFQGYTLFPWMSVKQNVMFGPRMAGKSSYLAESEAREWIDLVGLSKFENAYPHQLSGGMKQRVAIARVLANEANILLMDEPFGALDALTREQLQDELLQIWSRTGLTVIFVTHSVEEATLLADRVVVMTAGPGRIENDARIDLVRPRDVSSPEFNEVRRGLTQRLTSHVKRRELKVAA